MLLEFIKNKIGHGYITFRLKSNVVVYTVANKEGILFLLDYIHPYLRTPKVRQFNDVILWLNKNKSCNLQLIQFNKLFVENTGWLAGFIEAEANFQIHISIKYRLKIFFRANFDQVLVDEKSGLSYRPCLTEICEFFGAKLQLHKHNTGRYYFRVDFCNQAAILKLFDYLDQYPLYGIKSLDYSCFKEAFLYIKPMLIVTKKLI